MRALILIAAGLSLALPLGACKNNDQTDNTQNIDESLTAENIVSNDVTAIDAVTGDAANMAAESQIGNLAPDNAGNAADLGNAAAPGKPAAKPAAKRPRATAPAKPATTTNTASNAATNAAQ